MTRDDAPDGLRIDAVSTFDPAQRAALARVRRGADGRPLLLFRVLAHHPRLLEEFTSFGYLFLVDGELDPALRELAILRVAHISESEYEWHHHVRIALQIGLDIEEIQAVRAAPAEQRQHLSSLAQAVIAFTDEVVRDGRASTASWNLLSERLAVPVLLELTMLVGYYRMLAAFIATLGIQPDMED